jgi:hypothetical protein
LSSGGDDQPEKEVMRRLVTVLAVGLLLPACAFLRPAIPEVYYRARFASVEDSVCGVLAESLVSQSDLARDSSHEVFLGGSRCHEILYAPDGNEIWIQLRSSELTIAVRFYQWPGELSAPGANTQALADTAIGLIRDRYPEAVIERATERE